MTDDPWTCRVCGAAMWDNRSAPGGAINTIRGLTRSSDLTREGLAMKATRTCSVMDCDGAIWRRDLCKKHYGRLLKFGSTDLPEVVDKGCQVEGCERRHRSKGYCGLHYQRLMETGSTGTLKSTKMKAQGALCAVDGCVSGVRCRGLCSVHYGRALRTGVVEVRPRTHQSERTCRVDGCERPSFSIGYCGAHHSRYLSTGDPRPEQPIRRLPKKSERADVVARILDRSTRVESGCILFAGVIMDSGYGTIGWQGRTWVVHRAVWTALVGPIPEGVAPDGSDWTVDHLCSNRTCVNVGHLEVVSRIENSRRGGGLAKAHAANRARGKANAKA